MAISDNLTHEAAGDINNKDQNVTHEAQQKPSQEFITSLIDKYQMNLSYDDFVDFDKLVPAIAENSNIRSSSDEFFKDFMRIAEHADVPVERMRHRITYVLAEVHKMEPDILRNIDKNTLVDFYCNVEDIKKIDLSAFLYQHKPDSKLMELHQNRTENHKQIRSVLGIYDENSFDIPDFTKCTNAISSLQNGIRKAIKPQQQLLGTESDFYKFIMNKDVGDIVKLLEKQRESTSFYNLNIRTSDIIMHAPKELLGRIDEISTKMVERDNTNVIVLAFKDLIDTFCKYISKRAANDINTPDFNSAMKDLVKCVGKREIENTNVNIILDKSPLQVGKFTEAISKAKAQNKNERTR